MDTRALAQRVLAKAAVRVGGADRLAAYLKVTPEELEVWLTGKAVPPVEVVLRAADLLIDEDPSTS
jgi:hypothetical protein